MSEPVLNASRWQMGFGFLVPHLAAIPPLVPAVLAGLVEGPAFMGMGVLGAKTAPTVFVDGSPGIQQGHDVGALIPHIGVPPNAFMALNTMASKHKVMVPVASVLLEGKPVGTYAWGHVLGVVCAKPTSLPMGVLVNTKCTVWTTATKSDILHSLGYMLVDTVVDLIWKRITGDFSLKKLWENRGQLWALDLYWYLKNANIPDWAMEQVENQLKGALKSQLFKPAVGGSARGNPSVGPYKPFGSDPKW